MVSSDFDVYLSKTNGELIPDSVIRANIVWNTVWISSNAAGYACWGASRYSGRINRDVLSVANEAQKLRQERRDPPTKEPP